MKKTLLILLTIFLTNPLWATNGILVYENTKTKIESANLSYEKGLFFVPYVQNEVLTANINIIGAIEAENIHTSGTTQAEGKIIIKAKNGLSLKPGFSTKPGSTIQFKAGEN
jgi:hypothetical protein